MTAFEHFCRYMEKNHGSDFDTASFYGEPGYTDPPPGACVILANWNRVPKGLADALEAEGHELEWSDEWAVDYNSGKAYRTSPDSYGWRPSALYDDSGELLTIDDDPECWIEWATDAPERAIPFDHFSDGTSVVEALEAAGFRQYGERYETGFYPGQNDDPVVVFNKAKEHGYVVFTLDATGQFDTHWLCWVRDADFDKEEAA